ncbi:alanine or glycine:cation symporter, AGCS family [Nitrosomonas cryotolerans]|uniref:Alanine or glycine:cation symporter, AGCS family n=1 Tax=Nitrosomonas cryotolerans ATCC 49181 TaxID=1131553 RepID=A0A1N6J5Z3_9PROT|nr:alanine/glycine:cation symporter family protein [Nitrosomonas cryotolerans]SFP45660.1 alanine or glycine:cation symporter, AGCS family [Nitrosomonas cryotolerans]SIO39730.1 alanine or glycine:cation symporter, AGCS family [Nitrosomonas cryotolerans ATCC 49181]
MEIDNVIDAAFEPISNAVASVIFYSISIMGLEIQLILVWLVVAALFFTLYFNAVNLRYFKHAIDVLRGKYDNKNDDGEINRFQALMTSLSGTVGLGNIAGVAVAISVGGPGAAFWMAVMGLFGMSTKFAEVTLGVKYRLHASRHHPETISGGPMYYLRHAFEQYHSPHLGKFMAGLFAICCIGGTVGAGALFQANQAYQQALIVTGGDTSLLLDKGWLFGLFMAILVGLVIIGGIRWIAAVASRVVPAMAAIYIVAGFVVIGFHYTAIPDALQTIFEMALYPEAGLGAMMGALLMGVQRASFSNEAGLGSAAIAHSAVKTNEPISQGMVGMLGPFIDTVIICMVTALVIVISGTYVEGGGIEGVELTSRAFATGLSWFPYVLSLTVFLFAYSTMISWSYYGLKCATYLFGERDVVEGIYKIVFCLFIVVGASAQLSNIILFTDSMIFAMAIPNIIGLYMLAPEIKKDLKAYSLNIKMR